MMHDLIVFIAGSNVESIDTLQQIILDENSRCNIIVLSDFQEIKEKNREITPDVILIDFQNEDIWKSCIHVFSEGVIAVPVVLFGTDDLNPDDLSDQSIWDYLFIRNKEKLKRILYQFQTRATSFSEELKRSEFTEIREKFHNLIIQDASEGLLIIQEGFLKYVDPQIRDFLGYPSDELFTKPFTDFIHTDDRAKVLKNHKKRINGIDQIEKYAFRAYSKKGFMVWLEVTGHKIDWMGKPATLNLVTEVTDRVQAEVLLRESEERYKCMMHSSPNGIIMLDKQDRIIDLNSAFLQLTGYQKDDYIGKTLLRAPGLIGLKKGRQKILDVNDSAQMDQEPFLITITDKRGNRKLAEMKLSPLESGKEIIGKIATCRDVTEQKLASEKVARSEKMFRQLHDTMQEALVVVSMNGSIIKCNNFFKSLTGFSTEEIKGKNIQSLLPSKWHEKEKNIREGEVLKNGYSGIFELEIRTKTDTVIPVEVNSFLWKDESGRPDGYWYFFKDVLARKKYENELVEREEQLKTVLQYFPVPVIFEDLSLVKDHLTRLHKQGIDNFIAYFRQNPDELKRCLENIKITFSNQNALKFFGSDNLSHFKKFFLFSQAEQVYDLSLELIQSLWNNNFVFERETFFQNKSGKSLNVLVKATILPGNEGTWDTVLVTIIDLTESLQTDNQIRTLSQAITHSPVSVLITDTEGKIEFVNPKFTEVTGFTFEETCGKTPSILKSGYTSGLLYKSLWETIKRGEEWTGEIQNKRKNGELFWELASISGVKDEQGRLTHFVAIKEDITDRKKTEEELLKAKQKAEESGRLKTAFLANMSHEIRTPMNAIVGFSEIIRTSNIEAPEREEYFNIINNSCNTLSNLIDDIIDLAKIEAGQTKILEEVCRPFTVMKELQIYFNEEVNKSGKELKIILSENLPPEMSVKIDEFRLRQILSNLLGNAVKFTQRGFITWGVVLERNRELKFYVKDTGIGVPKENLDSIFDRFRQMDGSSIRKFGGTGLGLSVSKSLVELMGGRIWVESQVNRGSEFLFTLPYKPLIPGLKKENSDEDEKKEIYNWKNKNILIVEDNISNFEFIKAVLSKTRARLYWADTGIKAVEIARKKRKLNLVLMDLQIPEMDGLEATMLIKKILPGAPVIAQTAYAFRQDKKRAMDAGCDDYITKPIKPLDLLNLMAKYLK